MIEESERLRAELRAAQAALEERNNVPPTSPPAKRHPPVSPPEGVALYQCRQPLLPSVAEIDAFRHDGYHICGKVTEAKPYDPVPLHCDVPMSIAGYDWERDVT